MTPFEATHTINPGRAVMVRLLPAANRLVVEPDGATAAEVAAVLPELLARLATQAGLPVRYKGEIYRPRTAQTNFPRRVALG